MTTSSHDPCAAAPTPFMTVLRRVGLGVLLYLVVLAPLVLVSESIPLTWDEGDAFVRAERVAEWTDALIDSDRVNNRSVAYAPNPTLGDPSLISPDDLGDSVQRRELRRFFASLPNRRALFRPDVLEVGFQHAIYREGHPAGYSELIAFGSWIAQRLRLVQLGLSPKGGLRLGNTLFFALALTSVGLCAGRVFSPLAGVAVVLGVTSCPRVLCHALIAGGDSILISSWLLAWSVWLGSRRSFVGAALLGLTAGASFSAKYSGFALLAPIGLTGIVDVAVAIWTRRSKAREIVNLCASYASRIATSLVVAGSLFVLLNPPLWHDFPSSLLEFWRRNAAREGFNIPTYFFGEFYSLDRPLPWWNGLFWIVATTPTALLILSAVVAWNGLLKPRRRDVPDGEGTLSRAPYHGTFNDRRTLILFALIGGLVLPVVRSFPGLPVHDGARLMISSMAFWGLLGGLGAAMVAENGVPLILRRFRCAEGCSRFIAPILLAFLLAPSVVDVIRVAPSFLSFYSGAVGGARGASTLKLEPAYYWDGVDAAVVSHLRRLVREAQESGRPDGVLFSAFSSQTLDYYRRWNLLGTSTVGTISNQDSLENLDSYGFYVMQLRPSALSEFDARVAGGAKRVVTKRACDPIPVLRKVASPETIVVYRLQ